MRSLFDAMLSDNDRSPPGTYKTQELPCGIRVAANPWPVKMAMNITPSGWPQGGLIPWCPQGARAMWRVSVTPDISLFSLLHAPSAPPMTVANQWPLAEIVLLSKFSGYGLPERLMDELWEWFTSVKFGFLQNCGDNSCILSRGQLQKYSLHHIGYNTKSIFE